MKKLFLPLLFAALIPSQLFAQAVALPQHLNFDGQLLDSSTGNPLTSAATVVFEIYDGSGTPYCLLYKVTQSITPNSFGEFSTKIGPDAEAGHVASADDGGIPWTSVFKNSGEIRANDPTFCNSGYTPAAGHARKLRVTVNNVTLTPDYTIAPVPMATVAETLQGKVANDFLLAAPPVASAYTSVLTGNLRLNNNYGLQLTNAGSTNFVSLRAPAALTATYSLILPMDDGNSGDILSTDGNGALSWVAPSGGGAVTTVFGRTGAVVAVSGDYNASQITSTAIGSISATDVQGAIAQLESGKLSVGSMINGTMITDGSITNADLAASTVLDTNLTTVSVNKITSGITQYLTYAPGGTACALNETLRWDTTNWVCHTIPAALPSQTANGGRFLTTNGSTASWSPLLFDDGAGNFGLGTTAPATSLHIYATNARQTIESSSPANAGTLFIKSSKSTGGQTVGDIRFINTLNAENLSSIKGLTDLSGPANGALTFSTIDTGALTEKMRINSLGHVGIGTIAPTSLLDVNGMVTIRANGTAAGEAGRIVLRELAANGAEFVGLRAPDALTANYLLTLPSNAGSSGQVLQSDGTGNLLWVFPAAPTNLDFLNFSNAMNLDASTDISATGSSMLSISNIGVADSFRVNDSAADTSPFVIDMSGNVGIGTPSPIAKLDVAGNVKLGTTGTIISASGVCAITPTSYAANTPINQTCPGIPAATNVAVHCSPSIPVLGYIVAHATGTSNQISITTGVVASSTGMTCMWMVP